jgi:sarcosine oxidase gamma subunit
VAELISAPPGGPGCRLLERFEALTIRHFPGDVSARAAVEATGLPWSDVPGRLLGDDPYLAWCAPQELLAAGLHASPLRSLREALKPGRSDTAMAVDISDAMAAFELAGPRLDAWLCRLVDNMAIPKEAGRATRCRFADAAALLMRLETDRLWLVVDHAIAPYVRQWLAFAHEGAFPVGRLVRNPTKESGGGISR